MEYNRISGEHRQPPGRRPPPPPAPPSEHLQPYPCSDAYARLAATYIEHRDSLDADERKTILAILRLSTLATITHAPANSSDCKPKAYDATQKHKCEFPQGSLVLVAEEQESLSNRASAFFRRHRFIKSAAEGAIIGTAIALIFNIVRSLP